MENLAAFFPVFSKGKKDQWRKSYKITEDSLNSQIYSNFWEEKY